MQAAARRLVSTRQCLPRPQFQGMAVELGSREKALLEEDPALKSFKSTKSLVNKIQTMGNTLLLVLGAGIGVRNLLQGSKQKVAHMTKVKLGRFKHMLMLPFPAKQFTS